MFVSIQVLHSLKLVTCSGAQAEEYWDPGETRGERDQSEVDGRSDKSRRYKPSPGGVPDQAAASCCGRQ